MNETGRKRQPKQPESTQPIRYGLNGRKVTVQCRRGELQLDVDSGEIDQLRAVLDAAEKDRAQVIETEINARSAIVAKLRKAA